MHFNLMEIGSTGPARSLARAGTKLMVAAFSICLIGSATGLIPAAEGADAAFNQAVQTFTAGKYAQALAQFQVVSQKYPSDPLTRYYMGLCYQQLNQVGQAQSMYTWVERNARSSELKAKARAGLDSMNQYSSARTRPGSAPPPPAAGAAPPDPKAPADPKKADAKPEPKGALKCKKVIQFTSASSNEQRNIQMFGPHWDAAREKFAGKVDFQIVDADGSNGAELVKKYSVTSYPTVVFLDKDGKVLSTQANANGDIIGTIEGFK
ncbi:MAG: hypothetical protein C0507_13035 [Cyanobacteria bacterium PR.3.49]|jgi:thioredoxin-like negative regulator of GroEL|nr:hypothetical protein [Cyanobacteria bacterium PR.3.49]